MIKQAIFSPCRTYRYSLWREWDVSKGYAMFIGLNPSTADETHDDPTIRRCIAFAKAWGYGGLCMTNLFAFRATDPKDMKVAADPVGPENDKHLGMLAQRAGVVVAAWGANGTHRGRDAVLPVGYSIPAAEHSTTTIRGRENELETYRSMVNTFGGEGRLYAVVSDSYDISKACDLWGSLRSEIEAKGGTLVVRPDSGDPATVVLSVVKKLDEHFGSTVNSKGYKVLNPAVRVIQGDGINYASISEILHALLVNNYSADNIAFGMGGALLQQVNRDTLKFAMKASAAKVNGTWVDVYKDPVTDIGKRSKKGILTTIKSTSELPYRTAVLQDENDVIASDALVTVYRDGKLFNTSTFEQVRDRAKL